MSNSDLLSGLFAYPATPTPVGATICTALDKCHLDSRYRGLVSWEELDIPGRLIQTEILTKIDSGNIFFADITFPNFNVVFEIGYAIGSKKRCIITKNAALKDDQQLFREIGVFDTLGYAPYQDSNGLCEIITGMRDKLALSFEIESLNNSAPVYLVLPDVKTDLETHLISRIKKARLFYRSFDPQETGRLSALDAIEQVSVSHGIIVPFVNSVYKKSDIHNMRAAFIAGLAFGMEKKILLLQNGDDPIPLDYRDFVSRYRHPGEMDNHISEFASAITASIQSSRPPIIDRADNLLKRLDLGASSAENEFRDLGEYYLVTSEYQSVERGEVQVVAGRKGSGKSALFFQLRDKIRRNKRNVVIDLKPEGFELLKFKEQVLDYLEEGTRAHTITAFWEYLLLLEICHKILDKDRITHVRNHNLYEPYQRLSELYASDLYISEGDFAERMRFITQKITEEYSLHRGDEKSVHRLQTGEITKLLHRHDVPELRNILLKYLPNKESLWLLLDNLDKGWPPHGITTDDVLSLRCLLDAMAKLQREFRNRGITTNGVVFIRNDVYENLISSLSDRGKISHVLLDWTDTDLLLEVLRRRFIKIGMDESLSFVDIWHQICVSHINGQNSEGYILDRSMMRPRSLIEYVKQCRGHAINMGHSKIEVEDIIRAEEVYSTKLVTDISLEIGDVMPVASDVLYELIESTSELSYEQLQTAVSRLDIDETQRLAVIDLLIWYAVIGFRRESGEPTFIYTVGYDMKRFNALLRNREDSGVKYVINPAFWSGLEISH
ncbi:MAG: hypothetical protein M5R41_06335 [Bacteroidia bacterium]|nr:hypothetical protein [Bacteroidia bacterium]